MYLDTNPVAGQAVLPAPPLPTARLKARMAPPAPEDPSAWG